MLGIVLAAALFASAAFGMVREESTPAGGAPAIVSDRADYNPGSPVLLSGSGWQPLEQVHVLVNDDVGQTWSFETDVTADAAGTFTVQLTLPDWFVADYSVTATSGAGGTATTSFSDSAVQNVTVAVSPTTAGANAAYTIRFTPTNTVPAGDFIQIVFPGGTVVPGSIAAANITVNGTVVSGSVSINASQRQVQFDAPVALSPASQATVVIGASSPVIGNPTAGTYALQMKTKDDNNQATSANYTIVSIKPTTTALASSANPSTYAASITFTATVTANPTPNPNGAGTVTFKDGATILCSAAPLSGNVATCATSAALTAGSHAITASYSGAGNFAPSSGSLTQTVNKGSQTITFAQPATPAVYGASFAISATASSGLPVAIGVSGPCSYNGALAMVTMTAGSGTCAITASQPGSDNYNAAPDVTRNVLATKANQTIAVTTNAPPGAAYDSTFSVAANASSGLAVSFSSSGSCSNSGATFTMTNGSGTCTVKYDQAGDGNYNAAPQLTQSVGAAKTGQAITVTGHAPEDATYNSSFTVAASGGGSHNPVRFSSAGTCTNSGATVTMTSGSGTCTVKYDQAGDDNYDAAAEVTETVIASKAQQTIDVTSPAPARSAYGSGFSVAATASSGLPVSFGASGSCSNTGANFTMTSGSGTCTVAYDQAGNGNYSAASQVRESVAASKAEQTITFGALADKTYGDADFGVGATSSSGLPVSFTSLGSCGLLLGDVHLTGAGTCTITASQDGDANYAAAPALPRSFAVAKAALTLSANDATKVYGEDNPAFSGSMSGVVFPDAIALSIDSPATAASHVGTYPIVPDATGSPALLANYDVHATNGTLAITRAPLAIGADDEAKVYGSADPAFSAHVDGLVNGDTRASLTAIGCSSGGVHVGTHPISCTGGTSDDYDTRYTGGTLTITRAPLTVAADDTEKVYGSLNPPFTAQVDGLVNGDTRSALTAISCTSTGVHVGSHAITCTGGTSSDYDTGYADGTFRITPKPITISAHDKQKAYGSPDPGLTYSVPAGALEPDDGLSGALERAAGKDVGEYAITSGTLSAGADYALTVTPGTLRITPKPITASADDKEKVYGSADPELTYTLPAGALEDGDSLSGMLQRAPGKDAGRYPIGKGSLDAGGNYALTVTPGVFAITPKPITVSADDREKVYGSADPELTYSVPAGALEPGDGFSGGLSRAIGETVAGSPYAIMRGTLSAGGNYDVTFVGGRFAITRAPLTITADDESKQYGAPDPAFTAHVRALVNGDTRNDLTAIGCGSAGVHAGTHAITCSGGTSPNYDVEYVDGTLAITTAPLKITADDKSKVYGAADPAFTAQVDGLVNGDTRDSLPAIACGSSGIHVGTHVITCSGGGSPDYDVTRVDGRLTITKAPLTANVSAETKVYGAADPAFRVVGYDGFRLGDGAGMVTGTLACSTGATNAGGPYDVACSGLSAADYEIGYAGGSLAITKRPLTVAADAKTKVYGNPDPVLSYQITSGSLVAGDGLNGSLGRDAGESAAGSPYAIRRGTLTAGSNYDVTFVGANLAITKRSLTVTADAKTKVYGSADPMLTYRITSGSLVAGDSFGGGLSRDAGESVAGSPYAIRQGTLSAGGNYDLSYVGADLAVTQRPVTVTADAKSKVVGASDPALTYQVTTGSLVAGDSFSGNLGRDAGETVGAYAIRQGTLAAGANYSLTFATGTLNILYAPATASCSGSASHSILQPINPDGSSVWKQGSTVPAKFRVCDANGNPIGPTAAAPNVVDWFKLMGTVNGVLAPVGETVDSTTPDTAFRWSASDQLWIYNISTKSLTANKTYSYRIHLKDGTDIDFKFGLR